MGIKAVQEAVANSKKDTFDLGTVIRFTYRFREGGVEYVYAAIKTQIGWVTTAQGGGIGKVLSFDEFLDILASSGTSDVAVATEWSVVE